MVLALAIIFLLNPLVNRLERRRIRRSVGTIAIYLVFITLVGLLVGLMTPVLIRQVQELVEDAPRLFEEIADGTQRLARRLGISLDELDVRRLAEQSREQLSSGLSQLIKLTSGALHLILTFVLAPIIALYILIDLPRLKDSFLSHLPPQRKEEWLMLLERSGNAVGNFFRGQLVVAAIVGVMSAVGLWLAGIPFWLPIGLVAGFFNIIPLIGPFIGGAIAVIVGGFTGGIATAGWAAFVMFIVQQVDNHLVSPKVMGRAVRLQPVTIIVALLVGATLAGFWGMLLSVPSAAVGKIVVLHYYSIHVLGVHPKETEPARPAEAAEDGSAEDEQEEETPAPPEKARDSRLTPP